MHRLSQPLPAQLGQYIGWVRPSLCIAHQFQRARWVIFEETLNGLRIHGGGRHHYGGVIDANTMTIDESATRTAIGVSDPTSGRRPEHIAGESRITLSKTRSHT
jgi:hypothetical protein